jgi:hypothetical protein
LDYPDSLADLKNQHLLTRTYADSALCDCLLLDMGRILAGDIFGGNLQGDLEVLDHPFKEVQEVIRVYYRQKPSGRFFVPFFAP